jgi:molybdenum cofactor guanylyltransferase
MQRECHPEALQGSRTIAVVILAGGSATRFPGKLETDIFGEPLLARVYRQLRDVAPVTIAGRDTFSPQLDALLDCPIVVDRWPGRGPLAGLVSAALELRAARIFAVAGDSPLVTRDVVDTLLDAWQDGDEAAIPEHGGRLEPLAALYDRTALLREGLEALRRDDVSMLGLIARMHTRRVACDSAFFLNVNTADDIAKMRISV